MGSKEASTWVVPWWAYLAVGLVWWGGIQGLQAAGVATETAFFATSAVAFAGFGGLCWWNGRACGSIHCRISGPGFLVTALLALLGLAGVGWVTQTLVMGAFWTVFIGSFVVEWAVEQRGSRRSKA